MSEHDNLQNADGKKESTNSIEEPQKETEKDQVTHSQESPVDVANPNLKMADATEVNDSLENIIEDQDDDSVINEIDESNAEDAEDEGNKDRHNIEHKDYDKMSLDQLADELEELVKSEKVQAIKSHVENLRAEFKSKFNSLLDEKKEEFLNDGGNEIDFYYSSPVQKRFKETYRAYRDKLNTHYKNIEKSLKDNLANRLEIIEEIKGLFNVEENINTTYKYFKELQERWKTAGPIPRDKYNNAWNSYHHHVEMFYDFLHLNRDLRDLEYKHNIQAF